MKKIFAWVFKLKLATDSGFLFKLRCYVLHVFLFLANIDLLPLTWKLKKENFLYPASKKLVAIFSMYRPIFWHGNIFEMQINKGLARKGYQPVHFLCRGFLDVCDTQYYGSNKKNNPTLCKDCRLRNSLFYARNNAMTLDLDDYLDVSALREVLRSIEQIKSIEEAKDYQYAGLPLGRLVRLSVCRYWLRLTLLPEHLPVYKDFLRAAVKLHQVFSTVQEKFDFKNHLIFNGRYATYNIPLQLIKKKNKPFHTYEFSEQERILYTKDDIGVMWNDIDTRFQEWLKVNQELTPDFEKEIEAFIQKRREVFVAGSGYVDLEKSIDIPDTDVVVFTNIVWDSGAFERETIFESQFDWLDKIIYWGIAHPEYKLVVRIHPAEVNVVYNKSLELMADYIAQKFPKLPGNVVVIPAQERRNSYQLMQQAKIVLTYTSSIGLEAAIAGKSVIAGASTHYTRLGITLNPMSQEEFFSELETQLMGTAFHPDGVLVKLYVYWFYKIYHYLNDVNLYKKPFKVFEDSWFLRVPKVEPLESSAALNDMIDEFVKKR